MSFDHLPFVVTMKLSIDAYVQCEQVLKVHLHYEKANAKAASLLDGLLVNLMCYLHWVATKNQKNLSLSRLVTANGPLKYVLLNF